MTFFGSGVYDNIVKLNKHFIITSSDRDYCFQLLVCQLQKIFTSTKEGYVTAGLCYEWILMNFSGNVDNGPWKNSSFGEFPGSGGTLDFDL